MGQVNPAEDNKSEAKPRNCYLSAVNRRFCFFAEIKKQSSEAFLSAEALAKAEAKEGNSKNHHVPLFGTIQAQPL